MLAKPERRRSDTVRRGERAGLVGRAWGWRPWGEPGEVRQASEQGQAGSVDRSPASGGSGPEICGLSKQHLGHRQRGTPEVYA